MTNKAYPSRRDDWRGFEVVDANDALLIGGWQVMQGWERPLMREMARQAVAAGSDILEVGFGMGISAGYLLEFGCLNYTVIEAHPVIAQRAREWGAAQDVPVTVLEGFWEEVVPTLEKGFDAVLFDTYPLTEEERHRNHYAFIPEAPRLLRPGGVLVHYSDETTNFRAEHLRSLLENFDDVHLIKVRGLRPPPDCEYWSEPYMVIPVGHTAVVSPDPTSGAESTALSSRSEA